jgi:hypothetical protein
MYIAENKMPLPNDGLVSEEPVITKDNSVVATSGDDGYSKEGIIYSINSDRIATVVGYIGDSKKVRIPEMIGDATVEIIDKNAFQGFASVSDRSRAVHPWGRG